MSNSTHRKKIARRLSTLTGVTYQQALTAVVAASAAGAFPRTAGGLDSSPETLEVAARVARGWLPLAGGASGPTAPTQPGLADSALSPARAGDPRGLEVQLATLLSHTTCQSAVPRRLPQMPAANPALGVPLLRRSDGEVAWVRPETLARHGLIAGMVGAGRQAVTHALVSGMLEMGWSGVVFEVDPGAASGPHVETYNRLAAAAGAPARHFDVGEDGRARTGRPLPHAGTGERVPVWLDPTALGPRGLVDALMSAVRTYDTYWRDLARIAVERVVVALDASAPIGPEGAGQSGWGLQEVATILAAEDPAAALHQTLSAVRLDGRGDSNDKVDAVSADERQAGRLVAMLAQQALHSHQLAGSVEEVSGADLVSAPGLTTVAVTGAQKDTGSSTVVDDRPDPAVTMATAQLLIAATDLAVGRIRNGGAAAGQRFVVVNGAEFVDPRLLTQLVARARSGGVTVLCVAQDPTAVPVWDALTQCAALQILLRQSSRAAGIPRGTGEVRGTSIENVVGPSLGEAFRPAAGWGSFLSDLPTGVAVVSADALPGAGAGNSDPLVAGTTADGTFVAQVLLPADLAQSV